MNVYKPLRTVLLGYELLRFLLLVFAFAFFPSLQAVLRGEVFPFLVYVSPNALFPLICFFLFLGPGEYRNYLPLYTAGKTISVVLFYVWAIFNLPPETGSIGWENYIETMLLLGGAFFISLGDVLSILGTWVLNRKLSQVESPGTETDGGTECE